MSISAPRMKRKFLEAGRVTGPHGVKGEVKILPMADSAGFLLDFKVFYIDGEPFRVTRSRVAKNLVIAAFEGFGDYAGAMRLKDKTVRIDREDARLPAGRFFLCDIVGAEVFTEAGEKQGTIAEVLDLPGGNVYVVRGKRDILIPAVPEFILNTDIESGRVTVRLADGM